MDFDEWLDPGSGTERLLALARASYEGPFEHWPVSGRVNYPRNDDTRPAASARGGDGPVTDAVWKGWWVVRWGERLVHIEADHAADAVEGSIDALRGMGDWPETRAELSVHPYVEHHRHSRPRDFTRAVIDRHRRAGSARKNA